MKKFIAAILAAAAALSLCSCSGNKTAAPEGEAVVLEQGTVEHGVYENASMGIKISLGEGWTFYSDEEIAESIIASDFVPGDDTENLEVGNVFCDMYCSNDDATNVNVSFEYAGTDISTEEYLNILDSTIKEQFAEVDGFAVKETEISTAKTGSGNAPCLNVIFSYDEYGITIYETVIAYGKGSYIAGITVAAASQDVISDLLANTTLE